MTLEVGTLELRKVDLPFIDIRSHESTVTIWMALSHKSCGAASMEPGFWTSGMKAYIPVRPR